MEPSTPNVARMYDYYLGGDEALPVDREAAELVLATAPQVRTAVAENRGFLERVVTHMAAQGIDQFLDIGSGLPTQRNVHQILAEVSPGARVVYVDYDPVVVERSIHLLAGIDTADCMLGDVRKLSALCDEPRVSELINFDRPVGVLLLAVLNFVGDEDNPAEVVSELRRLTAPGSLVALSHGAREQSLSTSRGIEHAYRRASGQAVLRTRTEVLRLLDGCEILPPGLVYGAQWTAEPSAPMGDPGTAMTFAALARL
ncbi:SAM-dependent methyltransferase [Allocatelliglobosispora scoriae]|uniref:SAM-dependent methyltransferase n=1 Tax=Allocatelliglobosispora scoriae TaxID=643052 RepID=A0A841C148_9ACTN|nr:SAM-dependent methyltransferase [Allocatelliglobosispora scoriae]MBB5872690.1 SAM-dependent methyltransferase [Allocatelliglobosispora scoriae]